MKNLNELLEAREALDTKTADLLAIVRGSDLAEKRDLTEDENADWESLKAEKRTLDKQIKLAEDMAKHYEEKNLFVKINHQTWTVKKQEFVTATPGDPF